jgi:hypothetical protein
VGRLANTEKQDYRPSQRGRLPRPLGHVDIQVPGRGRQRHGPSPEIISYQPAQRGRGAHYRDRPSGKRALEHARLLSGRILRPAQPDILIGYQKDTSDDFTSVPHLLSTTTGETVAALPSSNALFLATDGVVIATGLSSGPTSATASAFSFSGEQQWEQQLGECEKIAFDGVPSLDVIQRSLTELAGTSVIVAENGAALVSNESGGTFSLRNEDGTSGPSLRVGDRFTLLADGSGVLTVPSRENRDSDLSPEDMLFIDAASGNVEKYFSELEFPFSHHEPQSVQNLFFASTVHELAKGSPNRLLAKTREGVTCYVPAT